MNSKPSIQDFYNAELRWIPENLQKGIGNFNVFKFNGSRDKKLGPVPFVRKDFYKISLLTGNWRIYFGDRVIETGAQSILFSNPLLSYQWEPVGESPNGYCCLFTASFFSNFGKLSEYPLFQPNIIPVFELSNDEGSYIKALFERMFEEISSDYIYRYDALKNLTFDIVHTVLKKRSARISNFGSNSAQRISVQFLELLERQFPIENLQRRLELRSASDYADRLAIHVNHLNKALKKTTNKTTTVLIAERVIQEAKILLEKTNWSVSDIAQSLGFNEVTHFNNFFKKHENTSPSKFRMDWIS
ncbi:helix-turn-helix transcriptional regulator [Fulvivirga ulvae]|uniref:helix-turn-helix domain-containing protein n=1 Tax=Fulvivirga ulvae TaxID=2904245 RepID=UPI001F300872|nr:AraC family transcriptional regulator [Fulvivirga ulvae]UII31711.1 helix-turn-helix transcriptional regulator [Fulvivirga ulvae]